MNRRMYDLLVRRFGKPSTASRKAYKRAVEEAGGSLFRPRTKEGLLIGAPVLAEFAALSRLAKAGQKAFQRRSAGDSGQPSFWGYGSVFGVIDSYHEATESGCFARSIEENFAIFRTLWQHLSSQPIGIPTEVREDDYGLVWDSPVETRVERVAKLWPEIETGLVAGLSIGYWLREYWWDEEQLDDWGWPLLRITDVDLIEVSAVTWGANPASFIEETRAGSDASDSTEESNTASSDDEKSALARLLDGGVAALACESLTRDQIVETLSGHTGRSARELDQVLAGGVDASPEELVVIANILGIPADDVLEASVADLI